jgi:hypothetical protein
VRLIKVLARREVGKDAAAACWYSLLQHIDGARPLGPVTPAAHAGPALRAGRDAARTRRHCGSAGSSRRWCVATPRDVRLRGGRAP